MGTVDQFKETSNMLANVSDHLMINGSMVFFSGLLYGKLGISLFFFHYARYTGYSLYNEYALYLIDMVKSQLHEDYPLDYERGLAGVGAGFDYLKKHGYFDVGDELMCQIDSKIAKAVSYERSVGWFAGLGRYLLSRHERNPNVKDSLIKLADLLINHSKSAQIDEPVNKLSLLCDLYDAGIEKEKIERYLSGSIDALTKDVQINPLSEKLFTLIKISHIPSCIIYRSVAHDALNTVFIHKQNQLASIYDLQWLLQCNSFLKNKEYQDFMPKIKRQISTCLLSLKSTSQFIGEGRNEDFMEELFTNNHDFAFKGGYTGLGLALISILEPDSISWTTLL